MNIIFGGCTVLQDSDEEKLSRVVTWLYENNSCNTQTLQNKKIPLLPNKN